MNSELQAAQAQFARFQAVRKDRLEPFPLALRQLAVGLMKTNPTFLVAEAVRISKPVLYKWRKELAKGPQIKPNFGQVSEPGLPSPFIDMTGIMAPQPHIEPSAVWDHPVRGRLAFSGLTPALIGALVAGFMGEVRL